MAGLGYPATPLADRRSRVVGQRLFLRRVNEGKDCHPCSRTDVPGWPRPCPAPAALKTRQWSF